MTDFNDIFVNDETDSTRNVSTEQEDADRDRDRDADRDDLDVLAAEVAERVGLDEREH